MTFVGVFSVLSAVVPILKGRKLYLDEVNLVKQCLLAMEML